jgi:hypothetical protein
LIIFKLKKTFISQAFPKISLIHTIENRKTFQVTLWENAISCKRIHARFREGKVLMP